MSEIASRGQLRAAYLRWAVVTVPFVLLLGFASARLAPSGDANPWYAALTKPAMMPPDLAFPVAWTILYFLLGLALAMVLHARGSRWRGPALAMFAVMLGINFVWTPLFFGAHQLFWSLVTIGVLFVLGVLTAIVVARVRTGAALLMLPYLAWIAFAGLLLYQTGRLNPNADTLVPSRSTTQIPI